MPTKFILSFIFYFSFCSVSWAMLDHVEIEGKIRNFSQSQVEMETPNGGRILIPRKLFKKEQVRSNKNVKISINSAEFFEILNNP
ncbi:MAG: hypothetical protein H7Z71_05145 [Moraxellaceae bacterium]|nr:hypothetical protein [Pseudobdellovibrionaceae bacterium]